MTHCLLDTKIIGNVVKPQPLAPLLDWMAGQQDEDLFIASLTVAEIRRGILNLPDGKKRDALETWFAGNNGPQVLFAGRKLSFDGKAGLIWSRLMADGKTARRPRSALDMIVAAVAEANDGVVVTGNERDFRGYMSSTPCGMKRRETSSGGSSVSAHRVTTHRQDRVWTCRRCVHRSRPEVAAHLRFS